jgi:hypothetical protein
MNYTFTININIIKILKFYLMGFIPAYLIVLYLEIENLKSYLKANNFTWKEMKKKYFLFFNKRVIQGVPMSWLLVLLLIFAIIGNINTKLSKYFWWIRFKDILKFVKKDETLYFYCNNKYFHRVKEKLKKNNRKKIIYRIFKGEIKVDNYSKESFEEYVKPLTLENYERLFDFEERDNLKANYELLVFERFSRYYLRKII